MPDNQNSQISITYTPTNEQLNEIYLWLEEEERLEKFAGFFCNWNSVLYSFGRNELAVICAAGKPVGFMSWLIAEKTAQIQLAEIKPDYRKKGMATILTDSVLDHLHKQGIFAVRLHCQPQNSELAWKKIGFQNFPDVDEMRSFNNEEEGRYLYKILAAHQDTLEVVTSVETLELWAVESYMRDKMQPSWSWNLEFKENTRKLTKPIIAPAKHKWHIRWTKNNQVVKEGEIKYFSTKTIHFDTFLMIEELML